jgi:crotonobetainyl-CoA:carnitine CoA-transferase CaiB-like acyl-CoA transferase
MGVLDGLKVVEIAALGPAPVCGAMLADLGADVIVIERPADDTGRLRPSETWHRGKRSVVLDLKKPGAVDTALTLIGQADALVEGMRPGVMERLGLGPEVCLARRPSLVYGRMTGWGQDGPLKQAAGHDGNYIGISGALWMGTSPALRPEPPPGIYGDVAGGTLYLAIGLLAGVLRARHGGPGQVVDAAMVDCSAHLMNLLFAGVSAGGDLASRRPCPAQVESVLSPLQAARHPHNVARGVYTVLDGGLQVTGAPRFLGTPSAPTARVPTRGEHTQEVLAAPARAFMGRR